MAVRYPGLAPGPEKLMQIQEALRAAGKEDQAEALVEGDGTTTIREEAYSGEESASPHLKHKVTQLIRSLHWMHQKQILDHVEAIVASDRQWAIVRRILFDIQKQQEHKMTTLVGRLIMEELTMESDDGSGRGSSDSGSTTSDPSQPTVGAGPGAITETF